MGKERSGDAPRIVCVAVPVAKATGQVLLITSRRKAGKWVLPKGGWETSDTSLGAAAQREALEEAGVRGIITKHLTTIMIPATTYEVFEMDVTSLDATWIEAHERKREWVDYATAYEKLLWKPELAEALSKSSLAPRR